MDSLHSNIKELRRKKKISRHNFADELNISYSSLSKYETGERNPDVRMLSQIAEKLDVSIEELLTSDSLPLSEQTNIYRANSTVVGEIISILKDLSEEDQKMVLYFVKRLGK